MTEQLDKLFDTKLILAVFLSAIVLTSGCNAIKDFIWPGGNNSDQGFDYTPKDGLSVDFKAQKSKYFVDSQSSSPATFILELSNTGEKKANLKNILLEGASWASGKKISITDNRLEGVNRVRDRRGDQSKLYKTLQIPKLKDRREAEYYVGAVVDYEYSTTSTAGVSLYPRTSDKRPEPSKIDTDNSGGPIKAEISGKDPMYVSGESSFNFVIENVGDGEVVDDITLELKTGSPVQGSSLIGQKTISFHDERVVSFTKDFGEIDQRTDIKLILNAEYTYRENEGTEIIAERPN